MGNVSLYWCKNQKESAKGNIKLCGKYSSHGQQMNLIITNYANTSYNLVLVGNNCINSLAHCVHWTLFISFIHFSEFSVSIHMKKKKCSVYCCSDHSVARLIYSMSSFCAEIAPVPRMYFAAYLLSWCWSFASFLVSFII